jgi:two-component system LytT family sensor kinase
MNKRLVQHTIFWIAYILFEAYLEFAWISSSFAKLTWQGRFKIALTTESMILAIKIPLTYLVIYIIERSYKKRQHLFITVFQIATAFIAALLIYRPLVVYYIFPNIYFEKSPEAWYDLNRGLSAFLDLIFIVGVGFAIKQYRKQLKWIEREKNLVNEKLAAELIFLKSQTNPHFLFNTLNNIYALARKKSDDTADAVLKLSKLLRFMLYESDKENIPFNDELKVIDSYIELEKIRYSDKLEVVYKNDIDNPTQPIAPLILLPFIENAFKHGASENRFSSYIRIDVKLKEGQLYFMVENSKSITDHEEKGKKIGLVNVRRQLELMYPEHQLTIENETDMFRILLNINLLNHASI